MKRKIAMLLAIVTVLGVVSLPTAEAMSVNSTATVRFWRNHGSPNTFTSSQRTRGRRIGYLSVPISRGTAQNSPRFIDWFTTSATTGGQRVRYQTIVPNVTTWNLHARWSDPNVHSRGWTMPARTGRTTINIRNFSFSSTWQNPMLRAINSWNSSAADIRFNRVSTSNNHVVVGPSTGNPNILGVFYFWWYPTTNLTQRSVIVLNSNHISDHARRINVNISGVIEFVMAHELGHSVGLRDSPLINRGGRLVTATHRESLMGPIFHDTRNLLRGPTAFDVRNVNLIYRNVASTQTSFMHDELENGILFRNNAAELGEYINPSNFSRLLRRSSSNQYALLESRRMFEDEEEQNV